MHLRPTLTSIPAHPPPAALGHQHDASNDVSKARAHLDKLSVPAHTPPAATALGCLRETCLREQDSVPGLPHLPPLHLLFKEETVPDKQDLQRDSKAWSPLHLAA